LRGGEGRGKPECPEKNLLEQRREPRTNSTHIRRQVQESTGHNGHLGEVEGGGASALTTIAIPATRRHPCSLLLTDALL